MTPDDAARLVADNPKAVEAAERHAIKRHEDGVVTWPDGWRAALVAFLAALPDPQPADATTTCAYPDCYVTAPHVHGASTASATGGNFGPVEFVSAPATESDAPCA